MSDESEDTVGGEGRKHDVRFGTHEDVGVEVTRDLSGSGGLARGDDAHRSILRFHSVGARVRSSEAASAQQEAESGESSAPPASAADGRQDEVPQAEAPKRSGLLAGIARLFQA